MAFAQLTFRESLRKIEECLSERSDQLYHLGSIKPVPTLSSVPEKICASYANENIPTNSRFALSPGRTQNRSKQRPRSHLRF